MNNNIFKRCSFKEANRLFSIVQNYNLKCGFEYFLTNNETPFLTSLSEEEIEVEYFEYDALVLCHRGDEHIFNFEDFVCAKCITDESKNDYSRMEISISNAGFYVRFFSKNIPDYILREIKTKKELQHS